MLQFSPFHLHHHYRTEVEQLLLSAFPQEEHRPLAQWLSLIETSPLFSVEVITKAGKFVGFCGYWKFYNCLYVEHLAIVKSWREKGLGKAFIEHLHEQAGSLPMVLEAELPHDETATKRIQFYQHLGIFPLSLHYEQPSYTIDGKAIPMLLLTNQPQKTLSEWEEIITTIHQEVYEKHRSR